MVVLEINQLTGYAVNNKDNFMQQMGSNLKRVEMNDNKIILYLDQVDNRWIYPYIILINADWVGRLKVEAGKFTRTSFLATPHLQSASR